jgi:hypothetical protein
MGIYLHRFIDSYFHLHHYCIINNYFHGHLILFELIYCFVDSYFICTIIISSITIFMDIYFYLDSYFHLRHYCIANNYFHGHLIAPLSLITNTICTILLFYGFPFAPLFYHYFMDSYFHLHY